MQARRKTVHVVPLRKADILARKLDKYVEKGIRYWKSQGAAALAEKVVTKVKKCTSGTAILSEMDQTSSAGQERTGETEKNILWIQTQDFFCSTAV